MPRILPQEKRDKIQELLALGKSYREIMNEVGVAEATVRKYRNKGSKIEKLAPGVRMAQEPDTFKREFSEKEIVRHAIHEVLAWWNVDRERARIAAEKILVLVK